MLPADTPFVLLDDARPGGAQVLYRDPVEIVATADLADVRACLDRLRGAGARGLHAAGYLAYEAGAALIGGAPASKCVGGEPLFWFGLFAGRETLAPGAIDALLGDPAGAWCGPPRPLVARADYDAAFARVMAWIAAGDIYQANLSIRAAVPVLGPPPALYARLRAAAGAGWGGIVHHDARWLLSLSPELFFRTDGVDVEARPMKGTAPRGSTPDEDEAIAARLLADPKERAENLMIVDLLRNDLARVCAPGSVRVPALFAVERFPTVQQMVSQVEARLLPGRTAADVIAALFPCGSITGAPKRRATEVIAAVEADARGVYTGAIGAIGAAGDAAFNVAIRTLVLDAGADDARMGLGSAVVADATADAEWAECLAKGAFVTRGRPPIDLLATMRFDPEEGVCDIEAHLARLAASAAALGFRFDRHAVRNDLHPVAFRLTRPCAIRLRLGLQGAIAVEIRPLPPGLPGPLAVAAVPLPVDPADYRLAHKTSDRSFYDGARQAAGTAEVIFRREDGFLTEGSFTNLFVARDGRLVTPPATRGLQPGVLRARLIEDGRAIEGDLRVEDLRDGFLVGNALRGLVPARLEVARPASARL